MDLQRPGTGLAARGGRFVGTIASGRVVMVARRQAGPYPDIRSIVRWILFLLAGSVVMARVSVSVAPPASGLILDRSDGRVEVAFVQTGSHAWLLGVRSGDSYARWAGRSARPCDAARDCVGPTGVPTAWSSADGGNIAAGGMLVGIPDAWATESIFGALLALGLLAVGVLLRGVSPFGSVAALVAATSVAVAGLLGWVTAPLAPLVITIPAAMALPIASSMWRPFRSLVLATLVLTAVAVAVGLGLAHDRTEWMWAWSAGWMVPTAVVAQVGAVVATSAGLRIWRRSPGIPLVAAMTAESFVGRQAVRIAVEDQRDREAQSMHDRLLPRLASGIRSLQTGDPHRTETILRDLVRDVRKDLEQGQLLLLRLGGLSAALDSVAQPLRDQGIVAALEVSEGHGRPPWAVELASLRITQEAVNNVIAHADATQVRLSLDVDHAHVRLVLTDDGVGMEAADHPVPATQAAVMPVHRPLGLASMHHRAREVGGRLDIRANVPSGLAVSFTWPT